MVVGGKIQMAIIILQKRKEEGRKCCPFLHVTRYVPNSKEEIENARGFFFQEILRGRGINAYQNSIFCLSFLDKVLPIREVA